MKTMLAGLAVLLSGCAMLGFDRDEGPPKVLSDQTVGGFVYPESVGCDATERVLYVSNFGGKELKPGEKDRLGYISKVSLDGKVIEQRVFDEVMNKPKGIWIAGSRLWVTDIDSVWVFDTKSKKGRRLELPNIQFANDPAVRGNVLYVSDNRGDQLYRVEPADFLETTVQPKISVSWARREINPNGIWPARDGSLLMVGFVSADRARGVYRMKGDGDITPMGPPVGRLDGLYELRDGSLLITDWNAGAFGRWTEKGGFQPLATGFKGPADFCVMGDTVYVPDLVQSHIRIIKLDR